jgi:ketosteroid isomerase-like protein
MTDHPITRWHGILARRDPRELQSWLDEDAVFFSPVVHTPQRGRALVTLYLSAAFQVLFNDTFHYVREITGPNDAMLEFEVVIDGTVINGVDLIRWNEAGRVVEFKVLLRPLKAINLVHERMGSMLQASKPPP